MTVGEAAGLIMCSVAWATEAGIPQDKWIFRHAGASGHDGWFVSERTCLAATPDGARVLRRTTQPDIIAALTDGDPIRQALTVHADGIVTPAGGARLELPRHPRHRCWRNDEARSW